ncbi:hypothetical protein CR513_31844, partial [Mucuna pruriens]
MSSSNMKLGLGGSKPNKSKSQSKGVGCTHCGNSKHTHETSFKLHIYPDYFSLLCATKHDYDGWIIDLGVTDHMTYDSNNFINFKQPRQTNIPNANELQKLELLLFNLLFVVVIKRGDCIIWKILARAKSTICNILQVLHDSNLKCHTCILSMSHYVSYPSNSNKSDTPLSLLCAIQWFVTFVDDFTHMA